MKQMDIQELFLKQREKLFLLAYRMLGSKTDSEDVLQEAWLRLERIDNLELNSPVAYLTRIVTHLCIDSLRERQKNLSSYRGPWLPEPVMSEQLHLVGEELAMRQKAASVDQLDPFEHTLIADNMSMALLYMLERLDPRERAVLILKEVLGFSHEEAAELLEISPSNSRQLLSRARKTLEGEKRFDAADGVLEQELIGRLSLALRNNDVNELKDILCEDVCAYTDGGGMVSAVPIPLQGFERVTSVFSHLLQNVVGEPEFEWVETNNSFALLVKGGDGAYSHISITTREKKISGIYVQRNPAKLVDIVK